LKKNGWLPDGTIDWVVEVFPENIEHYLVQKVICTRKTKKEDERELNDAFFSGAPYAPPRANRVKMGVFCAFWAVFILFFL
jgi:hypothetical protein